MGAAQCPSCGAGLALLPTSQQAAPPVSIAPATADPDTLPMMSKPAGMVEVAVARIPVEEPAPERNPSRAPASLFEDPLKPRKYAGGEPSSPPITAIRAHGGDSAVSSSGAFEESGPVRIPSARGESRAAPAAGYQVSGQPLEELMEQAKNYVCKSCSTPVPMGHKFCGRCGAAVPPEILAARTQFFGQLQVPGKAKLILIRGEGVEGLSYQLNADQHLVGRNGQLVFPDDPFVSPKHANLFYRSGKLVVRDEGSMNGVFWRVRGTVDIAPGDQFLAGEQLFRVESTPKMNDGPAPDGTYFYSSPKHQSPFRIVQILQGGAQGMVVCARSSGLQIGREGGDLNFPGDLYMSASHCRLEETGGKLTLTDLTSRNGTYVRLKAEKELAHGDYLFIGRKLLRVEITSN
jgi:pSer/pThr/pTyr-binding forkhead associated (FHA) protein